MLNAFIAQHGRKFFVAVLSVALGACVTALGIGMSAAYPSAAPHIAGIVSSFAIILSVATAGFSGANAFVEGRHASTPAARQSGTLPTQTGD